MSGIVQKTKERGLANKADIYEEFILWMALPTPEKVKLGIETRQAFADYFKINPRTITRWQERTDFKARVRALRDKWAFEKTQGVIEGIYRSAVRGNDKSQKLWMQIFEDFKEKTEDTKILKVELGVNDIRFVIEQLPEQYKEKFYGYLREINDTAWSLRNAGQLEDVPARDTYVEAIVSDESDSDARNVPDIGRNEMAYRHTESVSENLERKVSESDNQSAAWRRKK